MGTDKALLETGGGVPWARWVGSLLAEVAEVAVEVGPGYSGLPSVLEEQRGQGPLVAVAAGAAALSAEGWEGPALVFACDLPRLTSGAVRWLADWPGKGAVVPIVGGRSQPLCARWSAADLSAAESRAASGERSLRGLPGVATCALVGPSGWMALIDADTLTDADTPEEALRAGATGVHSPRAPVAASTRARSNDQ